MCHYEIQTTSTCLPLCTKLQKLEKQLIIQLIQLNVGFGTISISIHGIVFFVKIAWTKTQNILLQWYYAVRIFPFSNYNQITSDSIKILISYLVPDMGFSPEISKPEKVCEINLICISTSYINPFLADTPWFSCEEY